jgi:hypothetical protein
LIVRHDGGSASAGGGGVRIAVRTTSEAAKLAMSTP